MQPGKPSLLLRPSLDTKFHIDYDWWETSRDDLRVYMLTHLTPEQRERVENTDVTDVVDYIDPETGEVFQLDSLGLAIQESAKQDDFISDHIGLVDSVFRAFLAGGNRPLSARELGEITGRDASTILKTIGGVRVYRGIRPYQTPAKEE